MNILQLLVPGLDQARKQQTQKETPASLYKNAFQPILNSIYLSMVFLLEFIAIPGCIPIRVFFLAFFPSLIFHSIDCSTKSGETDKIEITPMHETTLNVEESLMTLNILSNIYFCRVLLVNYYDFVSKIIENLHKLTNSIQNAIHQIWIHVPKPMVFYQNISEASSLPLVILSPFLFMQTDLFNLFFKNFQVGDC